MRARAIELFNNGFNCSQCLLEAAKEKYGIKITPYIMKMCEGISMGFGSGCVCCCLVAGIMILGAMFDEDRVVRLRLLLLSEIRTRHGCLDCIKIRNKPDSEFPCENVIGDVADIIDGMILERK